MDPVLFFELARDDAGADLRPPEVDWRLFALLVSAPSVALVLPVFLLLLLLAGALARALALAGDLARVFVADFALAGVLFVALLSAAALPDEDFFALFPFVDEDLPALCFLLVFFPLASEVGPSPNPMKLAIRFRTPGLSGCDDSFDRRRLELPDGVVAAGDPLAAFVGAGLPLLATRNVLPGAP